MLDLVVYEQMRQRPDGRVVMLQRWRSLLFLHFPADPVEIQTLLPAGLTVDTYPDDQGVERAWVGLVPFRMEGVTLRRVPEIPGLHAFPETNVRTYVHRDGSDPGVWFFSLEAANAIACKVARRFFHLPYHEADMSVREDCRTVQYRSLRRSDGRRCDVDCEFDESAGLAAPGSLEFFLVERYLLYAQHGGELYTGRVFHKPYPIRQATASVLRNDLVEAAGIRPRPFTSTLFSDGVDVEVFGLQRLV